MNVRGRAPRTPDCGCASPAPAAPSRLLQPAVLSSSGARRRAAALGVVAEPPVCSD